MRLTVFQRIAVICLVEEERDVWMGNGRVGFVRHQVSFRDIGHIMGLIILGEEVVIGLVL